MRCRPLKAALIKTLLVLAAFMLPGRGEAAETSLKLLISAEQQSIVAPFPVRLTLHIHNAGKDSVWLYRHVRPRLPATPRLVEEETETGPPETSGGSTLTPKLELVNPGQATIMNPAQGTVFESAGLPKPKLVRLAPGEDYEEKASVHVTPAISDIQKSLWGTYRLSATYAAQFSSGDEINRDLKVTVWQGDVSSNTIEIQLQPPTPDSKGEVSGAVNTPDNAPIRNALVTLNDKTEHYVDQTTSDPEGRYSFSNLPPGLYWVTARRPQARQDTAVFRHVDLTASEPSATQDLVIISQEIYDPQKLVHKPVLFRVTDNTGQPLDRVGLEVTWSNGNMVDNVKGETDSDGTVALELVPGRNFVTLKRHGCPKQDERADVGAGDGIDGFEYTSECAKK